jgi:hypothetical protein
MYYKMLVNFFDDEVRALLLLLLLLLVVEIQLAAGTYNSGVQLLLVFTYFKIKNPADGVT